MMRDGVTSAALVDGLMTESAADLRTSVVGAMMTDAAARRSIVER
jgi:hypothetical protein